jgi:ElaB/YqjD/DUF883 family membrane-anchored ribosome-binding protein
MDEGTRETTPEGGAQLGEVTVDGESKTPEIEKIRRDIAETREELGDTVAALAQKADVKSQAKAKVAERKEKLHEKQEEVKAKVKERPWPTAAAGALVVGLAIGWVFARR